MLVPGAEVERVIADPRIAAVTLTGSDAAGQSVAAAAGRALKKAVLELGGSDAFIVLEDADLDGAAEMAARARFQNAGQSCIAAKRFIVVEAVAEDFERKFVEAARKLKVGDPMDRATQVGPLARGDLRETLADQVRRSVAMGARVALGGESLPGKGFFYEPTILATSRPRCRFSARRPSGRQQPSFARATPTTPSSWPTTANSASAATSGRATSRARAGWRGTSNRAASSSTV